MTIYYEGVQIYDTGVVPDSVFHPAVLAADPGLPALRYDPVKAAALLDDAGWRLDPQTGRRGRAGVPFSFTLLIFTGSEDQVLFAQVAQESLRRLGIDMAIQRLDWPTLWSRLQKGEFQAALSGLVLGVDPDSTVYSLLHSSQIKGGQNYAAFHDPQVDAWLEAARRAVDPGDRLSIYRTIDRQVAELQPYTFLFFPMTQAALSRRVRDIRPSPRGIIAQYPGVLRLRVQ